MVNFSYTLFRCYADEISNLPLDDDSDGGGGGGGDNANNVEQLNGDNNNINHEFGANWSIWSQSTTKAGLEFLEAWGEKFKMGPFVQFRTNIYNMFFHSI